LQLEREERLAQVVGQAGAQRLYWLFAGQTNTVQWRRKGEEGSETRRDQTGVDLFLI